MKTLDHLLKLKVTWFILFSFSRSLIKSVWYEQSVLHFFFFFFFSLDPVNLMQPYQRHLILKDETYGHIKLYHNRFWPTKPFTNIIKWISGNKNNNKMYEITPLLYGMENGVVVFSNQNIVTARGELYQPMENQIQFECSSQLFPVLKMSNSAHGSRLRISQPTFAVTVVLLVGSHYSYVQSNCDVCRNVQWVSVLAVAFGGKCEICADTTCPDSTFSIINV